MRKSLQFLISLVFLFSFFQARSQSLSLAFSRVILLPKNVNDTVPAGKVWKLESWTYDVEIGGGTNSNPVAVSINGITHFLKASLKDGNGTSYNNDFPGALWFPAGTAIRALDPSGCIGALSIIEFTVTP